LRLPAKIDILCKREVRKRIARRPLFCKSRSCEDSKKQA
jgi:hypothetical protein